MKSMYRKANLKLDASNVVFDGYVDDKVWNGFACPCFSYKIAVTVLNELENFGYSWKEDISSFTLIHESDPEDWGPLLVKQISIETENGLINAFPIGAFSIAWLEV